MQFISCYLDGNGGMCMNVAIALHELTFCCSEHTYIWRSERCSWVYHKTPYKDCWIANAIATLLLLLLHLEDCFSSCGSIYKFDRTALWHNNNIADEEKYLTLYAFWIFLFSTCVRTHKGEYKAVMKVGAVCCCSLEMTFWTTQEDLWFPWPNTSRLSPSSN